MLRELDLFFGFLQFGLIFAAVALSKLRDPPIQFNKLLHTGSQAYIF
jgi:hypothetical protein